jgi:hypothetical protein
MVLFALTILAALLQVLAALHFLKHLVLPQQMPIRSALLLDKQKLQVLLLQKFQQKS